MTQRSLSAGFLYQANRATEAQRRVSVGFAYVARVGVYEQPPNAPSDLSATATSYTTVDVTWTDNSADETGFELQRSTSSGFSSPTTISLGPDVTSYTFTGLTHNTTYYIRVRAARGGARSNFTPTVTVQTPNAAPAAPTGFQATSVTPEEISFAWTDNATNETKYDLQFSSGGAWMWWPGDLPLNAQSCTLNPSDVSLLLTPGESYAFRSVAVNSYGYGYSNYVWITAPANTISPTAPSGLTVTEVTLSSLSLSWIDESDDEDGFQIERSQDGVDFTIIDTVAAGVTTYTDPSLSSGTLYFYQVRAYQGTLFSDPSNRAQAQTLFLAPAAPSDLEIMDVGLMSVSLVWTDNSNNEDGFWIERSQDGVNFTTVATLDAGVVAYTDTPLMPNTLYTYRVFAHRGATFSDPSNQVQAQTLVPAAPSNLTVEVLDANSVYLSWQDNTDIEQAYLIERTLDNGQTWTQIASLPANATAYTDTGLAPETYVGYRLRGLYPLVYIRSGLLSGRGLDLYDEVNGIALPAPDGWEAVDFDDSGWHFPLHSGWGSTPRMVAPECYSVHAYTGVATPHRANLIRSTFTLPDGLLISARLRIHVEDYLLGCYLNGVEVIPPITRFAPGSDYNRAEVSVPLSVFQPGRNVLALHFANEEGLAHAISYLLEIY